MAQLSVAQIKTLRLCGLTPNGIKPVMFSTNLRDKQINPFQFATKPLQGMTPRLRVSERLWIVLALVILSLSAGLYD